MSDEIPVKEIGALLEEVTTKIPKLITTVISTLYSPDTGASLGKAVGNMYKELIEAGIPKEDAQEMAKEYMKTLTADRKSVV